MPDGGLAAVARGQARRVFGGDGLLKKWPSGGPKLLEKVEGLGGIYSCVAVIGGTIYTMRDIEGACRVLALKGEGRWAWQVRRVGPLTISRVSFWD